jgi:hypothetical protein
MPTLTAQHHAVTDATNPAIAFFRRAVMGAVGMTATVNLPRSAISFFQNGSRLVETAGRTIDQAVTRMKPGVSG